MIESTGESLKCEEQQHHEKKRRVGEKKIGRVRKCTHSSSKYGANESDRIVFGQFENSITQL